MDQAGDRALKKLLEWLLKLVHGRTEKRDHRTVLDLSDEGSLV